MGEEVFSESLGKGGKYGRRDISSGEVAKKIM